MKILISNKGYKKYWEPTYGKRNQYAPHIDTLSYVRGFSQCGVIYDVCLSEHIYAFLNEYQFSIKSSLIEGRKTVEMIALECYNVFLSESRIVIIDERDINETLEFFNDKINQLKLTL